MLQKNVLLFTLVGYVLADPVPVPAPQVTTDLSSAVSFPTDDPSLSSELASISSLESVLSGIPTLPASVESYIESAASTEAALFTNTNACSFPTTFPNYLSTAPAYVKSALTSYEVALSSWYAAHSTDLGSASSYTGTYTFSTFPTPSYMSVTAGNCATVVSNTAKSTSSTTDKANGSLGTSTPTKGSVTSSSAAGTGTATGSAAGSKSSSAAAPAKEGLVLSFAGVFGVLGLMAAL